jgi:hypothetical protein
VTERGLSSHRVNCVHYKRHEVAALAKRKERSQKLQARRSQALAQVRVEMDHSKQKEASSSLLNLRTAKPI